MKNDEQFYTDGCGIMINSDDDVRLYYRNCYSRLRNPDEPESDPAEVHYMTCEEYDSPGVLKVGTSRHERYVDDLTGQPLDPELCRKARATEPENFKDKEVGTMRKVSEALRRQGKPPITVRWVETNKGDDANPKIRSRLVAREIRLKGEEAIFALTPPLESLRMVLSHATTTAEREEESVGRPEPGSPDGLFHGHFPGILSCQGRPGRPNLFRATTGD